MSDLFNSNGFKPVNEIKDSQISAKNYLCEYLVLKSALRKYAYKTDLQSVTHNRSTKLLFNFLGYFEPVEGKKFSFFYNILLQKNSKEPRMESVQSKLFCIDDRQVWGNIYQEKVKKVFDKNVSEFNYKLIHNILSSNKCVSKWKGNLDKNCPNCNVEEDIKHLIFDCCLSNPIWKKVSEILNINVTWKVIVIGFPAYCNKNTFIFNNVLSFVTYKIYKYKMKCRVLNDIVTYNGLLCFLKSALAQFYMTTKSAKSVMFDFEILNTLNKKL